MVGSESICSGNALVHTVNSLWAHTQATALSAGDF